MNQSHPSVLRSRRWRRWVPPVVVTGAAGTALVAWFEELLAFAAEFIAVILLTILAGIIYLFNHLTFKSVMPRREDDKNKNTDCQ